MYILIGMRLFKDFLNAPCAIRSMNGNGSESELKTAAYPVNDIPSPVGPSRSSKSLI